MASISLRPVLERRLRAAVAGDVLFDRFSRGRYATDASHYQIEPLGVVVPRNAEEVAAALAIAREEGVSVRARGGGASQSGQCRWAAFPAGRRGKPPSWGLSKFVTATRISRGHAGSRTPASATRAA